MTIRLFEYDAQMVLVGLESPTWNFGTKIPCFILILISPMPRKERVHLRLSSGERQDLEVTRNVDDGVGCRSRTKGMLNLVFNTEKL